MTQEPLYPEGHPKRIEQDSQRNNVDAPSPSKKKKKKNDRTLHASSKPVVETPENPNDISISDAETQSGDGHEPNDNVNDNVHVDAQSSNKSLLSYFFLSRWLSRSTTCYISTSLFG